MKTASFRLALALVAVPGIFAAGATASKATGDRKAPPSPPQVAEDVAELWEAPAAISRRDLFYGPWGRDASPDPNTVYTYVAPKKHGTNPGMVVSDPQGRVWHIKQGREAGPEVVVSRVLSAVGYHQPPVYLLPSFSLDKGSKIRATTGGRFRLSTSALKSVGPWSWYENPFVDTTPYRGLLVVLVILNSSDLKNANNTIYELNAPREGARRWFVVKDLGTSLGDIGRFDPKPNDIHLFEQQKFITGSSHGFIAFDYDGVHGDLLHRRITPDDVRWACRLLVQITDAQWSDAFRAGGYQSKPASRYINHIHQKIVEGLHVE